MKIYYIFKNLNMNNKEDVISLNYSKAKLTCLPKEILKNKDKLVELDISGNNFNDFDSVLEELKKFPKLKKLKINIYTQEQAKYLIDSMPNLEYLNDEPINDDLNSEDQDNLIEYKNNEDIEEEIIINIPLIKLVDKTFEQVFKKFKEFYTLNKEKEDDFQKIIEDFNNLGKKLKISENIKIENLNVEEIKKKLELYILLYNKLNKLKDEIEKKNSGYKENSIILLYNIIEENEKVKNKCNEFLSNAQCKTKDKVKKKINKNNSNNVLKNNNKKNSLKTNNKNDYNSSNQEKKSQKKRKKF